MICFLNGTDEIDHRGSITAPVPGSTLTGDATITFQWLPGLDATAYRLKIGTTLGGVDLWDGAQTDAGVVSEDVTGLPETGITLYVQLQTLYDGNWLHSNYSYTAHTNKAYIVTPVNGATFTATSATFTMTVNGTNKMMLTAASSPNAQNNFYYNSGEFTATTSHTITGLPENGTTVYVKLWSQVTGGPWLYNLYTYTAKQARAKAYLTSPPNNSKLTSSTVTFTWAVSSGAAPLHFRLELGSGSGMRDLAFYDNIGPTVRSQTVTGIPILGFNAPCLRLSTEVSSGVWEYYDYGFFTWDVEPTAFNPAFLTYPAPGPYDLAASTTFQWAQPTSSGAPVYYLKVGTTSAGSYDIYDGGLTVNLSASVTGIPTTGIVYVRLMTVNNSGPESLYYDYEFGQVVVPGLNVQATGSIARYTDPYDAAYLPWVASPPGGYDMIDGAGDVVNEAVQWIIDLGKPYNFVSPVAPYTFKTLAVLWSAPIDPADGTFMGPWTEITTAGFGTWNYPTHHGVPTPSVPPDPEVDDFWFTLSADREELTISKYFGYDTATPALYCLELHGDALIDDYHQPHPGIAPQSWCFYIYDPDPPV